MHFSLKRFSLSVVEVRDFKIWIHLFGFCTAFLLNGSLPLPCFILFHPSLPVRLFTSPLLLNAFLVPLYYILFLLFSLYPIVHLPACPSLPFPLLSGILEKVSSTPRELQGKLGETLTLDVFSRAGNVGEEVRRTLGEEVGS